jgi:predicted  nucleic acid-binding Zn-ribbon protein
MRAGMHERLYFYTSQAMREDKRRDMKQLTKLAQDNLAQQSRINQLENSVLVSKKEQQRNADTLKSLLAKCRRQEEQLRRARVLNEVPVKPRILSDDKSEN